MRCQITVQVTNTQYTFHAAIRISGAIKLITMLSIGRYRYRYLKSQVVNPCSLFKTSRGTFMRSELRHYTTLLRHFHVQLST